MATRDKLIFPSAITWLLHHFSVSYPKSPHFTFMCAIDAATVKRSIAQLRSRQPSTETATPPASTAPSTSAPLSLVGGWLLRPSWHSLCAWMLTLTLLVMSCVRWTPMLVELHDDKLLWVVSLWLPLHLRQPLRMRVTMALAVMMYMAHWVMMRCLLDVFTLLSFVTKRGNNFEMRVVILIGGGLV